jgi:hypothetical protein
MNDSCAALDQLQMIGAMAAQRHASVALARPATLIGPAWLDQILISGRIGGRNPQCT